MKFNKKQKKIMRFMATILFSIALILILKLAFNVEFDVDNNSPYNGTWYIGYKYYEGNDTSKLVYVYSRKLNLFSNNKFSVEEAESYVTNDQIYNGTYKISDDKLELNYEVDGKKLKEIYYLIDDKICVERICDKYYTKNKLDKYFEQFNSKLETEEE